jgi:hypothetical protein
MEKRQRHEKDDAKSKRKFEVVSTFVAKYPKPWRLANSNYKQEL